jgi:hypothetical protein
MNRLTLLTLCFASFAIACSSGEGNSPELVGTARAAITNVPSGVGCIQITAAGFMTVTRSFDVTPGQSSVLSLSKLPTGTVTFSGAAFNSTCAMAGDASTASWLAPPVTTTITPGVTGSVTLNFDTNGSETVCANFNDGSDAGGCSDGSTVVKYGNSVMLPCFSGAGGYAANFLFGTKLTIPSPITVTALGAIATSGGPSAVLALYGDSGGAPGALVARTAPTALAGGVNELPVASKAAVPAGTYWIAGEFDSPASICTDATTANQVDYVPVAYPTVPNPWSPAPNTLHTGNINFYVVGTP